MGIDEELIYDLNMIDAECKKMKKNGIPVSVFRLMKHIEALARHECRQNANEVLNKRLTVVITEAFEVMNSKPIG